MRDRPLKTIFVPTPFETARELLKCLKVGEGDVLVDLGSGDGRIPLLAVREFRASTGIGIELDETLCSNSYKTYGDFIEVICGDLFFVLPGLRPTVITAYLSPLLVEELEKLVVGMKGVRVGLHDFPFPNLRPKRVVKSVAEGILWPLESTLYCYEL